MDCKLLAIDSSTSSTGIGIFINGEYKSHQIIVTKNIKNKIDRFEMMMTSICDLIEKESPQIVITELTVVSRNAEAQRNLSMLLGAIYYKCLELGIEYHSMRPTEWRKLVRDKNEKIPRKREELKKWSQEKVCNLLNVIEISDDISDAILLGMAYINKFD